MKYLARFFIFHFSFFILVNAGITDFQTIEAAQQAYKSKDYNKSSRLYNKLNKVSAQKNYNLGNAYYKSGRFDSAIKAFKRAKGLGVTEYQRLHNLGNAYFKKKEFKSAIKAYEKALRYKNDPDTEYNLELAKKKDKKKQNKKKQKKDKKKQKKDKKKQKKKQKEDKKKQKKKQKEDKKKQKKNNKSKQKKKNEDNQKKKQDDKKDGKKQDNKQKQDKQSKDKSGEKQGNKSPEEIKARKKRTMGQKEIRRLMKKMGNKKMPTLMYRADSGKKAKRSNSVNPW